MVEYDCKTFDFGRGSHATRQEGMCIMEAVAYVAGEKHTDRPACASPCLSMIMRRLNDSIDNSSRRTELLSEFVFRLVGTNASKDIEAVRYIMLRDWVMFHALPRAMDFVSGEVWRQYSEQLRSFPRFIDTLDPAARQPIGKLLHGILHDSFASSLCSATLMRIEVEAGVTAAFSGLPVEFVSMASAVHKRIVSHMTLDSTYRYIRASQESLCRLIDRMVRLTEPQEAAFISAKSTAGRL